jgi:hypothetical protein
MLGGSCGLRTCLVILLLGPPTLAADESTPLFNGKNLFGWTYHLDKPGVRGSDVWSIKDGVLRCTGQPAGYLITKQNDFDNYTLTVQWRWPEKGGNNGVLVHVTKPNELGVWPKSLEVQLQSGNAGELWVIGTTLQVEHPTTHIDDRRHKNNITGAEKPLGQWNTMEITCRGNEISVSVNGYPVNHATKLSQQRGAIALQSEGTPIEFREVSIRKALPIAPFAQQRQPRQQPRQQPQPQQQRPGAPGRINR